MSNFATVAQLQRATSQLPVSWYCDPEILRRRAKAPVRARALLRRARAHGAESGRLLRARVARQRAGARPQRDGIELISNVCRHRQALMLTGRGNASRNIVCPIHRWTYDLKGQLLGAPHFADNPCLNLRRSPLTNWRGSCSTAARRRRATSRTFPERYLDFKDHVLDRIEDPRVQLQLEELHRGLSRGLPRRAVPPGLGQFVSCDD
jgi:choline monooxygenase